MAHMWFRSTTTDMRGITSADLNILNQATRMLVDRYNLSPTRKWLKLIRRSYQLGMTTQQLVTIINQHRETPSPEPPP
jgi:hypothetical protein